jgi:predicted Zn finger-like uncharacterized protein
MLVQCPKCKTTYKVSDDVVKGATPSFRCSRCKHTFELAPEPDNAAPVFNAAPETGENRELVFAFEPDKRSEPEPVREDLRGKNENSRDPAEPLYSRADRESDESAALHADQKGPPKADHVARPIRDIAPAITSVTQEKQSFKSPFPARESTDNVVVIQPYRDQPVSVALFLTLFILLVLLFAFIAAYQKTQPAAAQEWLRNIPFVGHSVIRNYHVKNGVVLKSVETKYQSLQGSREVVVLTGVAVNQNPVMIRNVQLAGQLYDQAGKEIERQTMWIGNAISAQIIRGMTAQDIADLQRLKPLKTFEIPSGDSVPFAIVFLRAGKPVKDARCEVEVVSAEGDA